MKKLIVLGLLTFATFAQAQHRHGHYHHHHYRASNWVAPAIIGGVVGYAITRNYYEPAVTYTYPPQVYVQQPMFVQPVCGPWTETQYADGTVTRTRTCQ